MSDLTPTQRWNLGHPGFYKLSHPKAVLITHYGIAEVDQIGRTQILELTPKKYNLTDRAGFSGRARVTVHDWKPLSAGPVIRERVVAMKANYPTFKLFGNNCEHAANEIWDGKRQSTQVKVGIGIAVGLLFCFFAGIAGAKGR